MRIHDAIDREVGEDILLVCDVGLELCHPTLIVELEVELEDNSLDLAELPEDQQRTNEVRGLLEWHFTLEPGAAQTIDFSFEVSHPADRRARGLDD